MATLSTPVFCNHFFPWGVCADPPIKRDEGTSYGFGMFNCHVWWPEGNYNSPFVHNSVHPQHVFSGKSTESLDLDSCCWFPLDPLDLPDQSIGRPKRDFDFALCRAELMLSRSQELVTGATYERTPLCLFVCLFACVCGCVSASVSVSVSARVSIKVCVCVVFKDCSENEEFGNTSGDIITSLSKCHDLVPYPHFQTHPLFEAIRRLYI